ncbi:MAG TPA: hypothetical protein VK436_13515 [Methanocella sp.]|nr:hypothetical protein [Methanocella sp.]
MKGTLYIMPLVALAMLAMMVSPIGASLFSIPKLGPDHFSLGNTLSNSVDTPDTTTKVEKSIWPMNDLSTSAGIGLPFGGFNPFYSPVTSHQSYQRMMMTPDGKKTRILDRTYDGNTGERVTTTANF